MLVWRRGTDTNVAECKLKGVMQYEGGFHKGYTSHDAAKLKKKKI